MGKNYLIKNDTKCHITNSNGDQLSHGDNNIMIIYEIKDDILHI